MLAQIPIQNATPSQLGEWLIPLAALLGIGLMLLSALNQWKQYHAKPAEPPPPERGEMPVTRAEMEKLEHDLSTQLGKYEEYTRTRLHELANAIQAVGMKQATQPVEVRSMIDAAIKPMSEKIDKMALMMAVLVAKSKGELPLDENGGEG